MGVHVHDLPGDDEANGGMRIACNVRHSTVSNNGCATVSRPCTDIFAVFTKGVSLFDPIGNCFVNALSGAG